MYGWKTSFLLGSGLFSRALAVSFRESRSCDDLLGFHKFYTFQVGFTMYCSCFWIQIFHPQHTSIYTHPFSYPKQIPRASTVHSPPVGVNIVKVDPPVAKWYAYWLVLLETMTRWDSCYNAITRKNTQWITMIWYKYRWSWTFMTLEPQKKLQKGTQKINKSPKNQIFQKVTPFHPKKGPGPSLPSQFLPTFLFCSWIKSSLLAFRTLEIHRSVDGRRLNHMFVCRKNASVQKRDFSSGPLFFFEKCKWVNLQTGNFSFILQSQGVISINRLDQIWEWKQLYICRFGIWAMNPHPFVRTSHESLNKHPSKT